MAPTKLQSPRPATGVSRGILRGVSGALRAPGSEVSKKCPESVPGVSKRCPDTSGTLSGHFLDTPEPGARRAPETPRRTPRGHSRDTSGPKGPRDSCSRPGRLKMAKHISPRRWGETTPKKHALSQSTTPLACTLIKSLVALPAQASKTHREGTGHQKHGSRHAFLACAVAIYRMGNRSGAKIQKNGKKNGKWPPAWNGRKMATEMEKWPQNGILAIFSLFFPFWRPFFGHFSPGAISHFFPFFSDFCAGPVSHSVDGHRARNAFLSWAKDKQLWSWQSSRSGWHKPCFWHCGVETVQKWLRMTQGAPKGRQQKGETGPGTHIFADCCRFSLIFGSLCKSRDLGVADLRRKPQETADFRRKPQKTADFAETGFSHLLSPFSPLLY